MKSAVLIIGAIVVVLFLAATISALNAYRMESVVAPYNDTTGAGETTANLTLTQDLFNDETRHAAVTSNLTADAPVVSTYTSATNVLMISGLQASNSRRLTITYQIDALSDYYAAGLGARIVPTLVIVGVIGLISGAVYTAVRFGGE